MTKQEKLRNRMVRQWGVECGPGTRFRRLLDMQQYNLRLMARYGMLTNKAKEKYGEKA